MIDKNLGFATSPSESYYFALVPSSVAQPASAGTGAGSYKFALFKGAQKFDESKATTPVSKGKATAISGTQLNFYLPNFNAARKIDFQFKIYVTGAEEVEVGTVSIDTTAIVKAFKDDGTASSNYGQTDLGEGFAVDFDVYVEKSRYALDKLMRGQPGTPQQSGPASSTNSADQREREKELAQLRKKENRLSEVERDSPEPPAEKIVRTGSRIEETESTKRVAAFSRTSASKGEDAESGKRAATGRATPGSKGEDTDSIKRSSAASPEARAQTPIRQAPRGGSGQQVYEPPSPAIRSTNIGASVRTSETFITSKEFTRSESKKEIASENKI